MLPVYKARQFIKIYNRGGRTKPWLVLVDEDGNLVPYVVKMFTTEQVLERDCVTNEVIGNVLAKEFDLLVPNAALIIMEQDFIKTIDDPEALITLGLRDRRIKFGTRLISPILEYQAGAFPVSAIKEIVEIDMVFAFDNLIRNRDRNNGKPNFFITRGRGILIDHEAAFNIEHNTASKLLFQHTDFNNYRYHIFLGYLNKDRKKSKEHFFNLFAEYLNRLNVSYLDSYLEQLVDCAYPGSRHPLLRDYLLQMKQNSATFVTLLRAMIE